MEIPMSVHESPFAFSGARRALLLGCAIAGLCAAAGQVDAQAFNANPKTVAGSVNYDRATPGVETITVDSPSAIINWTPSGVPSIFLPQGNTATFVNGPSVGNYAVLNRILTLQPVRFDGTVLGLIGDLAAGTAAPGGTIIFSSPGGIIIGATAVFDVGNLVLTSLNVVDDGTGNFFDANGTLLMNGGAGAPNAAIVTEAGAQIRALTQGSYVAMVAPRIVHGGSVRVNGSVAYVAGEQVQLRVNQGLFDIIVDTGSDNAVPLIHTGSTGGPASTGAGDLHGIYMVAVPKNQAITAILQGNVGFDPAVDAAIENGVIVLSAGFNVVGGQVDRYGDFGPAPKPGGPGANFEIRGGTISSDLFGFAATDMLASGQATGKLAFLQDVSLFAGRRAHLFAGAGQAVTVGGNAVVSAARLDTADPNAFDLTGGEARIFTTQGGSINITGNATVDASAMGIVDQINSRAGNGTGGTAEIFANTGSVRIGGTATVLSTGRGGVIDFAPMQGGTGTGGAVSVEGRNGGNVQIGGALNIDASGTGSRASGLAPAQTLGAPGTGGNVSVAATGGGNVTVAAGATITSNGTGGNVLNGPGNAGGTGRGGNISILAGGTLTFTGATAISANGFGGLGPNGGAAIGGRIVVDANAGQIDFLGDTIMDANATGGNGAFIPGGDGGNATGGSVLIRARNGATASRIAGAAITINARGAGGAGASGAGAISGGDGGDGQGGTIDLLADAENGSVQFGAVTAVATGIGGAGGAGGPGSSAGAGGDGSGGDIRIGTVPGQSPASVAGSATLASATLTASGTGGTGGPGGAGGNAAGGTISLLAAGAPTQVTGLTTLNASAFAGGAAGTMGLADGGTIIIAATAAGGSGGTLTAGNVSGIASAFGAPGTGNAPGEWHVTSSGGSAINLANLNLTASATGTPAVRPFSSLEPLGGTINVGQNALLISLGDIRVIASGAGRITGGQLSLAAGDNLTMTHTAPVPGGLTVDVTDFSASARLAFSAGAGVVTRASNQTSIAAIGNATVLGQILGGNILLTAAGLDVGTAGAIGGAGTNLTDVRIVGNATVAGQILGRTILMTAGTVDVAATGAIGAASSTDLADIRATGNAAVAGRILGRDILLAAGTIGVGATGVIGGAATDRSELRALGNVAIAGRVLGRQIQIGSSDIDVAATGAVGDAGTVLTTLLINDTGQSSTLGGTTQGLGYTLTAAEANRIRSGTLRVAAPGLVVVRDLTLGGGGAAAGLGIFEIATPGIVRVDGALLMTNARAGDGISIDARQRLEVVTPAGSVRVRDSANMPGGTMLLASNNIWIASQAIIDRLRLNPNYAGRDADLLDNGGIEEGRGYVEGGGVVLATGGTLFVQNSGPPFSPAFGGVTVGAGGLTVRPTGAAPVIVTGFGRQLNPDGSLVLATPFFLSVNFEAGPGYTLGSTFNTCVIVTRQCGAGAPVITPSGPDPITGPTGGAGVIALPGAADEDDLVDTSFSSDALIEEPVTSGGESSLWECDDDKDGDCDDRDD
jgi:hypothetical protein